MDTYLRNLDTTELQKSKLVIGQFITSCSHSMRGPLKSITGLVNLLQDPKNLSPQDTSVFLDLIYSTVNKMENTLDELEHFLENSNREIKLKSVDCRELVDKVLDQFKGEIIAKHVKINLTVEHSIPFSSDGARLRIILGNLLSNAIQFRDVNKKDQEINIKAHITALSGTFSISDNGIGIDPQNHAEIFQLFFRATELSSGIGVGLYVVKEAVEKMGGEISLESVAGQGSMFRIVLPNHAS